MRHLVLLSMMVLAARSHAEESCVLRVPLKATVPGGISTWQSLPAGTTLMPVHKKSDWSRVKKGDDLYVVATAQLNNACTAAPAAAAPTTTTTTTAAAAPVAAPAAAAAPVAAPAAAAAPVAAPAAAAAAAATTTTAAAPAAPAAAATTTAAPATTATTTTAVAATTPGETPPLASLKAKTEPQSSSTTPGQVVVFGALALGALGTAFFVRRRTVVEQQHLDVVASRTLGRNKQLLVVDAGDARLLLGVTEQGITVLSSMPQASRAAQAMGPLTMPGMHTTQTTQTTGTTPMSSHLSSLAGAFADEAPAAGGLLKGFGAKMNGLWGKPPAGSPAEWDSFDRILASTVSGAPADDAAPSMSRRSAERPSTGVTGAADIAELARDLNRAGLRRSA